MVGDGVSGAARAAAATFSLLVLEGGGGDWPPTGHAYNSTLSVVHRAVPGMFPTHGPLQPGLCVRRWPQV